MTGRNFGRWLATGAVIAYAIKFAYDRLRASARGRKPSRPTPPDLLGEQVKDATVETERCDAIDESVPHDSHRSATRAVEEHKVPPVQ